MTVFYRRPEDVGVLETGGFHISSFQPLGDSEENAYTIESSVDGTTYRVQVQEMEKCCRCGELIVMNNACPQCGKTVCTGDREKASAECRWAKRLPGRPHLAWYREVLLEKQLQKLRAIDAWMEKWEEEPHYDAEFRDDVRTCVARLEVVTVEWLSQLDLKGADPRLDYIHTLQTLSEKLCETWTYAFPYWKRGEAIKKNFNYKLPQAFPWLSQALCPAAAVKRSRSTYSESDSDSESHDSKRQRCE